MKNGQPGSRHAKFVLPTVETCPWRRDRGTGGVAECRLISSLIGSESGELSAVTHDACAACCESFPPSPRQLNPVVAGLLYSAAANVLASQGTAECSLEEAARIQELAERSLDVLFPEPFRLTPARSATTCGWLGDVVRQPAAPRVGDRPDDGERIEDEPVRTCRHPAHETTTLPACRMCRDWVPQPPVSRFLSLRELIPPPDRRCGKRVERWAVGVTTTPRRQPTLETCLDGIVRAGWDRPRLFLDGTLRLPSRYAHLPVTWREERAGALPSWYLALAELLLQEPAADAYILLQDDVALYDREPLRAYLETILWPGDRPGIVSLFYTGLNPTPGWHCAAGEWDWGAQGFVFAPEVVRGLLSDPVLSQTWMDAARTGHIPIPETLLGWVRRTATDVWYANPSLAQHIGNTSAIWMDAAIARGRRAPWFSGSVEAPFAAEESLADFPEHAFTCQAAVREQYRDRVESGRRRMQGASVVICGLCRDVRHYLPRTAARIERLGGLFADYRVVLFENDSNDATCEFLFDWRRSNPRVDVLSESAGVRRFLPIRSRQRAEWLATCRNRYLEQTLARYADFDFTIVLDTDLPGGWSFDGVAHTFGNDDWDVVGSYGIRQRLGCPPEQEPFFHYDVWAFRPARGTFARKLIDHNKLHVCRGDPLLPVESCFGGMAAYRMACFAAATYGGSDCEHVVFHDHLRRAGFDRQFLNPSQITLYSPL